MKSIQAEMGDANIGLGPGIGGAPGGDMKDPMAALFGDAEGGEIPAGMKELFESFANMGGPSANAAGQGRPSSGSTNN
jgi:hypothetical protein